jgi:hypothetical protein
LKEISAGDVAEHAEPLIVVVSLHQTEFSLEPSMSALLYTISLVLLRFACPGQHEVAADLKAMGFDGSTW